MEILDGVIDEGELQCSEIGIITPYAGQVGQSAEFRVFLQQSKDDVTKLKRL
jgi:hypothetical protein